MIAVDTNLLVDAHREDSPWHEKALARVTELADSGSPWAIPWSCVHEFLAISLHYRVKKLWSADRDFSSFPELVCENPLVQREK